MKALPLVLSVVAVAAMFITLWPMATSQSTPVKLTDPTTEPGFCRIDFGTTGFVNDDTFYLSLDGDDDLIEVNDIRLTPFGTAKAAGTVVTGGDSGETVAADCQAATYAYYDVHPNGRFGIGPSSQDMMLIGYNKGTSTLVEASTHTGDYWVRLSKYGTSSTTEAGTIVMTGNPDFAAFSAGTALSGAEHAFWDKDASAAFGSGDMAYIAPKAVVTGDLVPVASVRLLNGTYHHGSLAAIGDSDVSLALTDPSTDAALCRIELGQTGLVDDGFYLSMDGDDDLVETNDLRLVDANGKKAGSVVLVSDSSETVAATCQTYTPAYFDMDSNGAYGVGDVVLIGYDKTTSSLVQPSTTDGDWWIRLTPTGSLLAGTMVNGGDSDYSSKGAGAALTGGEFAYFDADGNSAFSVNDWAYLTAAAIADKERPPNGSARIHNPPTEYAFGTVVKVGDRDGWYAPPSTTTPVTTTGTSTTTTTTTGTTTENSPTETSNRTTAPPIGGTRPTPGFEVLGILFALAVVAVAAARRRA